MIINGEKLYETWVKWTESEETKKIPFVLQRETWWGDERHMLVRSMEPLRHSPSQYEVKLFNHKFRPITLYIPKTYEFETIEDGRFRFIDWS